jgi:hypothetical protein
MSQLEAALHEQYAFLVDDCGAFDAGNHSYSRRLALATRVLLHDTANSHSLLGQMRLLRGLRFVDTSLKRIAGTQVLSAQGLAVDRLTLSSDPAENSAGWSAVGDDIHENRQNPPARFTHWWSAKVIEVSHGAWWSRGRLALALANKDGAHVDPTPPRDYLDLLEDRLGMSQTVGGEPVPLPAQEWADMNMRQIAHELVRSLQRDYRIEPLIKDCPVYSPPPNR